MMRLLALLLFKLVLQDSAHNAHLAQQLCFRASPVAISSSVQASPSKSSLGVGCLPFSVRTEL
jgi:hypothetical protein